MTRVIASANSASSSSSGFAGSGSRATTTALAAAGKSRQCLAKVLEYPAVIHDQAVVLALVHPVGAGDGLHQRVSLERFVEV